MNPILAIFWAMLAFKTGVALWLNRLNAAYVERHRESVPPALAAVMDAETYRKANAYTLARLRHGLAEEAVEAVVLAVGLGLGLIPWLFGSLSGWLGEGVWGVAASLFLVGVVLSLPGLPLEYAEQFRLEERFGFNRSTPRLWWADKAKGLAVQAVLFLPLLALVLWLVELFPGTWWLWGFAAFFGFSLLIMVLYPMVILPWFNKLSPLAEGPLRERLMSLAERTGFRAQTIQVMDGSKRSAHANAYFTGFGRFRRIVLFDTLMEQLPAEQLEAVLAHEIGHYRLGHIPRMLALSAGTGLAMFGTMGWMAGQPWVGESFGFAPEAGVGAVLLLATTAGGLVTFWFGPLGSWLSRRHEFEADAFARKAVGGPGPLVEALRGLSAKNLSNLTPHPVYSGWYYSHPTLVEREAALLRA